MIRTHVAKDDLPREEMDGYEGWTGELGDYTVCFDHIQPGWPGGPEVFQGLPNDHCQCPHWGYVIKGRFQVRHEDGTEEEIGAGEAYYLPPGHQVVVTEELEWVEFSPTAPLNEALEVVGANLERLAASGG
jgi:hypothetical protein